ncbi:4-hydroxy-3-methylbut-2-enyl diphosphate reductase [Chloroflexota bacterium]
MTLKINKAADIGFCYGVRRALEIIEKVACEKGGVETLGAIVHNQQVLDRLAGIGVRVARSIDDIQGKAVVISSHGVSPHVEEEIRERNISIVNATCPFVHRVQIAARRLAAVGFCVIIYGDAAHAEVQGVLGWANGKGTATTNENSIAKITHFPRRIGILSQTTQIPAHFTEFVKSIMGTVLIKDSELRIKDTICHDIRKRQQAALELANMVDLMLVVGGHTSANTNHLVELCATVTSARLVEASGEIQSSWLKGRRSIGITAGASTSEQTIDEVLEKLKALS